jgi:hypothetical protein
MEVIAKEEVRKVSSAMLARLIGTSISPLTGDGLDEALSFAIGLRTVRLGEEVFDAELTTSGGEVMRAVRSATIGEHALDGNSMNFVELNSSVEGGDDASDLLVGQQAGESQARVIINGDVQALDPGMAITNGVIPGGTDARTRKAAQFLDVQVKQLAGSSAFVSLNRRFWRLQSGKSMQAMTAQDARDGRLGDLKHGKDLSVGATLPAQGKNVSFKLGAAPARLALGNRGTIRELGGEAALLCPLKPATNRLFADVVSCSNSSEGEIVKKEVRDHFRSHSGGKSGISVHVVRAGFRAVEFSSTTSLPEPSRADNLLKHDT